MRIYLIGYMASGKSNLGQLVAERMGYAFTDTDYLFEERFRISVYDFFEKYDEEGFRKIERSLLTETASCDNTVISTGGGTPCYFDNMQVILDSGLSVYLRWDVKPLAERLRQVRRKRPLLKDVPSGELEQWVESHLREREKFYNRANLIVDAERLHIDRFLELIRTESDRQEKR